MVLASASDKVSISSSVSSRFDLSIVVFDACGIVVELRSMLGVDDDVQLVWLTVVEDSLSGRIVDDMLALVDALKLKQIIISHKVVTFYFGVSYYKRYMVCCYYYYVLKSGFCLGVALANKFTLL